MSSTLPAIAGARLPDAYVRAKDALAACSRIDECKDWADKAEALASYAKQAKDDSLHNMALRIKARAIRRCGELLKQVEAKHTGRPKLGEAPPSISRKRVAAAAGLSDDQQKTVLRVANVQAEEFEAHVESEAPPTVTQLAEMGTHREQSNPAFPKATRALGDLRRLSEFCEAHDPLEVASAVMPHEVKTAKARVAVIDRWLDVFVTHIGGVIDVQAEGR